MSFKYTPEQLKQHRKSNRNNQIKAFLFIVAFLGVWVIHVLFLGWYRYLFQPHTYVIKIGDILPDLDYDRKGTPWWNKYDCAAAREVAACNSSDAIATFTWRTHPFFLDNELLYVNSPKFKVRVWGQRRKIYLEHK